MRQFKKLYNKQPIDLVPYIREYLQIDPERQILIGCDSQVHEYRYVQYAITVGLYTPGKGAHVLFHDFVEERYAKESEIVDRLINEVWLSIEVAEEIRNQIGVRARYIDIDINPDPRYRSNKALTSALGVAVGMGYNVRHKGQSPVMTRVSDCIVK